MPLTPLQISQKFTEMANTIQALATKVATLSDEVTSLRQYIQDLEANLFTDPRDEGDFVLGPSLREPPADDEIMSPQTPPHPPPGWGARLRTVSPTHCADLDDQPATSAASDS